jgi:hypothetical protein
MAYKATGRPVGRPKTKEYVTLLARVPADLAELVKKYADQHQLSVATVLREGAAWRIGDGDPRGMGMYLEESTDTREKTYYANTETALEAESGAVLADMRTALVRQEAQIQALTQMLEQQTALLRSNVYSGNTETAPSVSPAPIVPRVKSDKAEVIARLQQMHDTGLDSTQIAAALQAEGVPTLSGKGEGHAGTVRKLLGAMKV